MRNPNDRDGIPGSLKIARFEFSRRKASLASGYRLRLESTLRLGIKRRALTLSPLEP
jgi:hypothetical protein